MTSVDNLAEKERQIHITINTLSTEIETLVEAIYKEPPDMHMMEVISAKRINEHGQSLF